MTSKDLQEFITLAKEPLAWLRAYKEESHSTIIGCLPMYVPGEMVSAAGALPAALLGFDGTIVSAAEYLHYSICHPMQGNLEVALRGDLDFLDGIVFADICDQTKRLSNVWQLYKKFPFSFHLRLPKRLDTKGSKAFYVAELRKFLASLEEFSGRRVFEEDLRSSIITYNQTRKLIGEVFQLRRNNAISFKAAEVEAIVIASMIMPGEQFQQKISRLLREEPARQISQHPNGQVRLMVVGNPCEDVEHGLLDMIEDIGGTVIDDCVYTGSLTLSAAVSEKGDPIEAIADAYIDSSPCPTKHNPQKNWAEYIVSLVQRAEADGVIVILPKYCEIYAFDYPDLKEKLSQANLSHIMLEVDHSGADARLRTRLQAFIEMLMQ
ncbi:2-hydroxyacyl-CoA dehydratase subunit D [Thermodesulfobacteriota bacterium]